MDDHPTIYRPRNIADMYAGTEAWGKRLVMWPACPDGWQQRRPYRGHVEALEQISPAEARVCAAASGATFRLSSAMDDGYDYVR